MIISLIINNVIELNILLISSTIKRLSIEMLKSFKIDKNGLLRKQQQQSKQ